MMIFVDMDFVTGKWRIRLLLEKCGYSAKCTCAGRNIFSMQYESILCHCMSNIYLNVL